jgi:hypothetical protein
MFFLFCPTALGLVAMQVRMLLEVERDRYIFHDCFSMLELYFLFIKQKTLVITNAFCPIKN